MTLVKGSVIALPWTKLKPDSPFLDDGKAHQNPLKGALMIAAACFCWSIFYILQVSPLSFISFKDVLFILFYFSLNFFIKIFWYDQITIGNHVEVIPSRTFPDRSDMHDRSVARVCADSCCWEGQLRDLVYRMGHQTSSFCLCCKMTMIMMICFSIDMILFLEILTRKCFFGAGSNLLWSCLLCFRSHNERKRACFCYFI